MTGLPSSQMFKPCGCTFRMLCWEHSRKFVHASSVDGHTRENRSRPSVNPDRHARIRTKHFTFAAELWDCEALDPSRRPFDIDGSFDWQNAMMDHDRAHGYFEAARNSAWGVS